MSIGSSHDQTGCQRSDEKPLVVVRNVNKAYPGGFQALVGINLNLGEGVFGLLGPNGAGKTTLLRILAGVTHTSSGEVLVLDRMHGPRHPAAKVLVGYAPEHFGFFGDMTGMRFLLYVGVLCGLSFHESQGRANLLLDEFGLAKWSHRPIREYSGGMKQRLMIIQAILHNPRVLLLDEPTKGLDPLERQLVLERVRLLGSHGNTVVISSHVLVEVEQVADVIGILNRGKLAFMGDQALVRSSGGLSAMYKAVLFGEHS